MYFDRLPKVELEDLQKTNEALKHMSGGTNEPQISFDEYLDTLLGDLEDCQNVGLATTIMANCKHIAMLCGGREATIMSQLLLALCMTINYAIDRQVRAEDQKRFDKVADEILKQAE